MSEIAKEIARVFESNNIQIFEVGGSVRDSFLNKTPKDIDFAVSSSPVVTSGILAEFILFDNNCKGKVVPIGEEFGTVRLCLTTGETFDFTTFRKEVYQTNDRHPVCKFGDNLIDDLARRDFTINAIARNVLTGEIIDPFNGRADLSMGIVSCVGSEARLDEDPLRMLRAIRFSCQLNFWLDIYKMNAERLQIISQERIHDEFIKILLSDQPVRGMKLLIKNGLMKYIIPELLDLQNISQGCKHKFDALNHTFDVLEYVSRVKSNNDLILRLSALLHDIAKSKTRSESETGIHFYDHQIIGADMVKVILPRLKFDSETTERVANLVFRHMEPLILFNAGELTLKTTARLMRRLQTDSYNDIDLLILLAEGDAQSHVNGREVCMSKLKNLIVEIKNIAPKIESPLSGIEIMQHLNLKPGPKVGWLKEQLISEVANKTLRPDDKDLAYTLIEVYLDNPEGVS